jgi:hypothetical protein
LTGEVEQVPELQWPAGLFVHIWSGMRHQGSPPPHTHTALPGPTPSPQQPFSDLALTPPHLAQRSQLKKWRLASSPRKCPRPGWRSHCPYMGEKVGRWSALLLHCPAQALASSHPINSWNHSGREGTWRSI